MTEAEKIYERFVNYEWNEVPSSLKESILKAINEALNQEQILPKIRKRCPNCNGFNVVMFTSDLDICKCCEHKMDA